RNRFGLAKTPLNIPIILFVSLIMFQLIPLPPGTLKLLSPNTHYLYSMVLPLWPTEKSVHTKPETRTPQPATRTPQPEPRNPQPETRNPKPETRNPHPEPRNPQPEPRNPNPATRNSQPETRTWFPISIYPYATKIEFFIILAYIGMFFLVTNTPGIRLDRIILIIMGVGFLVSFLGILQKFTGTSKIYWLIDSPNASLFGSFINRNHFAGYIGMVIPLSFGLLITRFESMAFHKTMSWSSILAKFESRLLGNILMVFTIMTMVSALFLSLSRGGILSLIVSIIVFVAFISLSRRARSIVGKGRKITITTLLLTLVFLMWLGVGSILERLSDLSSPSRHEVTQNTISMAEDFPLFGTGLGTFQYNFPKYKTLEEQLYWDHAHNDYAELLSDSGLIGFLIVACGIIFFIWQTLVRWWKKRDPYVMGITLGGFCGIIAILSHSIADFNLHIPVNALFLSFILGLTWSAVNLESTQMEE
ncbi:MAG: O-antigen ligase family protein, partial [Candidatus Scalindua sp.]|nr:O-antigen ligase family protein [Candidatus Scalindua sp.]